MNIPIDKDKLLKNKSALFLLIFLFPLIINPWGVSYYEISKLVYLSLFLLITCIWIFVYFIRKKTIELKFNKYVYLFLGFWIVSLILSTVLSIAPNLSFFGSYSRFQGLFSHLLYILFFILFFHFAFDDNFLKKTLKFILGLGIIVSLYAFLQRLGIDFQAFSANEMFTGRTFATFGHPNFLGQFLLLPIWISIFLAKDVKKTNVKYLYILISIVLLMALLTTENRASLLGLGVSFIIFIISVLPLKKIYKGLIGLGIVGGGIAFIALFAPSLRSIGSRFVIWKDSLNVIWENPIWGSGLETFRITIQKFVSPEIYNYENLYDVSDRAHNLLIDITATQGFIGLLVVILVVGALKLTVFKNLKKLNNTYFGIGCFALISILITLMFSFPLINDWIIIYVLIALLLIPVVKFKKKQINLSALTVFISSLLIATLGFANIYTVNVLRADILYSHGIEEFTKFKITDSFQSFNEANKINPFQDEIYYKSGLFFGMLTPDDKNELIDLYIDNAGWFNGNDFQYYIYKGILATNSKDYLNAEEYFKTAAEKAPNNAFLWQNWANKYYMEKDYQRAIEAYNKLIELAPEYWMWTVDIKDRSEDEQRKYRIFFKTVPMFLESIEKLADCYRQLGDEEKAVYYDHFLTIKAAPNNN